MGQGAKLTCCVSVKISYADFSTIPNRKSIPFSSTDHILVPIIMELFKKLYDRRMLIRLVGVKFSHLVHGNYQINLFYQRLEKELEVIKKMDFVTYFLINHDIVQYAQRNNYPHVGRGSDANSIVAYIIEITDVDPIELDLYFISKDLLILTGSPARF